MKYGKPVENLITLRWALDDLNMKSVKAQAHR